jgi:hypothetical protein
MSDNHLPTFEDYERWYAAGKYPTIVDQFSCKGIHCHDAGSGLLEISNCKCAVCVDPDSWLEGLKVLADLIMPRVRGGMRQCCQKGQEKTS